MRRLLGYKIVDEYNGFVPDELNEFHVLTDLESLNRFFRSHEYESQWIVTPVYYDPRSPDDLFGYKALSREEAEELLPDSEHAGRLLIGYQVVGRESYETPEALGENEIFTTTAVLNSFLGRHQADEDHWIVIPVYEGDVDNPEVIADTF
jgi:hypothetical protein